MMKEKDTMEKTNVILIMADQLRADAVAHLGNENLHTPNLDALAKDGVSFSRAFCQSPVCTPSRCSMMTGWYPHVNGHRSMTNLLKKDEPMLLRQMMKEGYYTYFNGKNDLVNGEEGYQGSCHELDGKYKSQRPNLMKGGPWRQVNRELGRPASWHAGVMQTECDAEWASMMNAVEYIKTYNKDEPTFMYFPWRSPHPPYAVCEPYYSMYDRSKIEPILPKPPKGEKAPIVDQVIERLNLADLGEEYFKNIRAVYHGSVARLDSYIGNVIDELKANDMYDNSIIIFTSDHGDYTGDYGIEEKIENSFEDCLTNVPLIIKMPKSFAVKNGINDNLVELIDIGATINDYLGIKFEHAQFGKSLLPLLRGEDVDHRDAVFCEGGRLLDENQCLEPAALREGGLFFPRKGAPSIYQERAVMCRTKDFKYVRRAYSRGELYDLQRDPKEQKNLIEEPELKDVLYSMKDRLLKFYLETSDVVPFKQDVRRFLTPEEVQDMKNGIMPSNTPSGKRKM